MQKLATILHHEGTPISHVGLTEECLQLHRQTESLILNSLRLQLKIYNFRQVARLCRYLRTFCQLHSWLHSRVLPLGDTITYLEQVFQYMGNLNLQYSFTEDASRQLSDKIRLKLQRLLAL